MHIPDGLLSTPVWLTLDVAAVPAVVYMGRKLADAGEESKAPLLGVMGAFVFAAQMINFPVGVGVSSHLMGSALLAFTLGPGAASVVLTAVLVLQALVFQDGGVLALGPNVMNMAIAGVFAAYLPYRLAGSRAPRAVWVFSGAFLSVFVAAGMALVELFLSGTELPWTATSAAIGLFAMTAVVEGLITVAVVRSLETIHPQWIQKPATSGRPALAALAAVAVVLATVGALFASANPDVLERFTEQTGIASAARDFLQAPLAGYKIGLLDLGWLRQSSAGAVGLALTFLVSIGIGKVIGRRRSA